MAWVMLLVAIVFEVAGTTCMKLSQGFSRPVPSILLFVFYAGSLGAFTLAVRRLELSVASAAWAGIGNLLIAVIGVAGFGESFGIAKAVSIALILLGVIGLQLSSS